MNKKTIFLTTLFFVNMCLLSAQQQTWEEIIKLTASQRATQDYFGYDVDVDGDYAIVGAYFEDEDAEDNPDSFLSSAGSAYIYKKEGDSWVLHQKIVPAVRNANDAFGSKVAISGDYAVIASRGRDIPHTTASYDFGAVYVFKLEGDVWVEKQRLVAPVRSLEYFGYNGARPLDIEGDYIVIGAYQDGGNEDDSEETATFAGGVYVFKRSGEIWDLQQKILASDRAPSDRFGHGVAINGGRIIVGATYEDEDENGEDTVVNAGSAYIFELEENTWVQKQKIVASDRAASSQFGLNVAISGNYAVVGSFNSTDAAGENPVSGAGAAYVFYHDGNTWMQQQKITAGDRGENDYFSYIIDMDGDRIVVGAYNDDKDENGEDPIANTGSAYIFKRDGTAWMQERKLVAWDRSHQNAYFGNGIAIDNDVILVGARSARFDAAGENSVTHAGAAYIFGLVCPEIEAPVIEESDPVCAGGAVTLNAAAENTINWYDSADSTEILHTGSAYTIENLTETTTYWVEAVTSEGCASERIPVIAVANPLPELTVLTPTAETCEGSPAELEAITSEGFTVVWYDSPDATEWIHTGNTYTPELTETTSYWVQAYNPEAHCVSERTEIVVTVLPVPVLNMETTEFTVCSGTEAELFATSANNVIFWYAGEEDEEYLYHGNLFITGELTETTTFWVEAYNIATGCASERIEVTVTVNPVPDAPMAVSVQTFAEGQTLADLIVDATGDLTWYANETLTVELPETTLLTDNMTYYVTQSIGGCESEAISILVQLELGISGVNGQDFTVYPNPTAGIVKIRSKAAIRTIEVFNTGGQRVTLVKAANEVNLSGYPSGTYVLRITLENGERVTKKIIKK